MYGEPILLVCALAATVQGLSWGWQEGFADFQIFYRSAQRMSQGLDPYALPFRNPNTSAPAVILAFVPFGRFSFGVAVVLWQLLGAACLVWSVRQIARLTQLSAGSLLALMLVSQAGAVTLRFGQVTFPSLALFTAAWLADHENRPRRLGVCVGTLVYAKPFFGLLGWILVMRRRSALGWTVLAFGVCALAGLIPLGPSVYVSWARTLADTTWLSGFPLNASWRALPARLFAPDAMRPHYTAWLTSSAVDKLVWIGGATAIGGCALWRTRREGDPDRAWSQLGLASILCSPLGWVHYPAIVAGPLLRRWERERPIGLLIAFAAFCIPQRLMESLQFGPVGSATVGSIYTWALLAAWLACSTADRAYHQGQP